MRWIGLMMLVIGLAGARAQPAAWGYEVVEAYPHDRGAFTQGLYFDGAGLVLGTGQYGGSSIRLVELGSGKTLKRRNLPRHLFGEGLARHGDRLYQLTWKSGLALVYDAATLEQKPSLRYRGEGWGVTSNGAVLITSDGSAALTGRDPATFAPVWKMRVTRNGRPVASLNELEFIGGRIYANIWKSDEIVVVNPKSGAVEAGIDFAPLVAEVHARQGGAGVLNGIAYDAERGLLLVTGKNWDRIYAVRLKR